MKLKEIFLFICCLAMISVNVSAKPKKKDPYYCATDKYIITCSTNGGYVACDIIPGKPVCCKRSTGDCVEDPKKLKFVPNSNRKLPFKLKKQN